VTKDSSPYFVLLSAPPGARPAPAALIARPSLTRAGARFLFARALAGPGRLDLYDVAGHRVRTLILPAGSRGADWDGTDARGTTVASGLYFARVTAAGLDARAKVAVAR
jgi:hypothetical protein